MGLARRTIVYPREVAAAIGRGRELESGPELHQLIVRLLEIRTSVLQLDVLAYDVDGLTLVASNEPRNCGSGRLGWPASESGRLCKGGRRPPGG